MNGELERGRAAYEAQQWKSARDALQQAADAQPLEPADLWLLALADYLTGGDADFRTGLERAHQAYLQRDDPIGAARCAFWLGFYLAQRGEMGHATGWLARASRLLERAGTDCVEQAWLLLPTAHSQLAGGDPAAAFRTADAAVHAGERFGDADLVTMAVHMQGRALLAQGRLADGLALLDESMVGVAAGEVTPLVSGLVYCSMIGACRSVYAVARAQEWTAALASWCAAQPDLVPYRGQCLVYRAEILQLHGAWQDALDEAESVAGAAETDVAGPDPRATMAGAWYQCGEVHRLRGASAAAEEAYRSASLLGREPQPGLALLRLAQGDVAAASAAIHRALGESADPLRRARLLPAQVEIALAAGETDVARAACSELADVAAGYGPGVLDTMLEHARGAVALHAGDALNALVALRQAAHGWRTLDAPYEEARARVLVARACRELGDDDTAAFEQDAARNVFTRLGAVADLAALDDAPRSRGHAAADILTTREREVLALVATGLTNRAIAGRLFISEKTVARHVSNIFGKLGLSSRAAATAWAYQHEIVQR